MVDADIEIELAKYTPTSKVSSETVERVKKYIKQGYSVIAARKEAQREYNRLRMQKLYEKADTTIDDKYMKDHFASLEEMQAFCVLEHNTKVVDGESLCAECQEAYENQKVEEGGKSEYEAEEEFEGVSEMQVYDRMPD